MKVLFSSYHNCLDTASGAAVSTRSALLACASTVLFWGTFLCSPIEPSVNAGETVPSETGKVVHTWKSKLIKSDKTLLEIVKEESPNIEVLPLQIFFYERLYDVTFERYLPFYRLKEAAVLATYDEAAECLDQIETLSGKEKACALFALTIFENKYRPRPQWMLEYLAPKKGSEELPYYPYHDIREENPLELWTCDYEPDETIEPSFWERWEKTYREAFKDQRLAFDSIKSTDECMFAKLLDDIPSGIGPSFYVDELVLDWNRDVDRSLLNLECYSATSVNSPKFLLGFSVCKLARCVELRPFSVFVQTLQGFEQFESDDREKIQHAYALREFLLLLTYFGIEEPEISGKHKAPPLSFPIQFEKKIKELESELPQSLVEFDVFLDAVPSKNAEWARPELSIYNSSCVSVNSSYREKTVGRIAFELQTVRLSYDGSILIPINSYAKHLEEPQKDSETYFDEWETRLRKTNKTLLEVVKKESKAVETLPYIPVSHGTVVSYDMTFERYLPVYRLKEAALASTYDEALECLEQLDSLSGKEKACALYALSYFVQKRGPSPGPQEPILVDKVDNIVNGAQILVESIVNGQKTFTFYDREIAEFRSRYARMAEGDWKPDYTIERSFWTRWRIALKKALDDKEIAFPAIASSKENYGSASELARSPNDDELTAAWFDNIDACAKLAEKYVEPRRSKFFSFSPRKVKAADFLAPCMNEELGALVSKKKLNAKSASKIDPNSFAARFLKGVDRFYSDDVAEMQEAYALREYWMNLHGEVPSFTTWSDKAGKVVTPYTRKMLNNSYHSKTVGEVVAKEIRK